MAVIAKAEITISKIASVEKITRYYLLQSSTAAVPSKPADGSAISSSWSKTEPSYMSGSTNTLYFVDQTILSDGTIEYSEVSKSSSYEAAKEAWNKANNAQKTADSASDKIDGLKVGGRNLLKQSDKKYEITKDSNAVVKIIWNVPEYDVNSLIGKKIVLSFYVYSHGNYQSIDKDVDPSVRNRFGMHAIISWHDSTGAKQDKNVYPMTLLNEFNTNKKRVSTSYVITPPDGYDRIVGIGVCVQATAKPSNDNDATWILANPKLEEGTIATDWSPAPEDAINSVSTEYYLSTSATSLAGGSWSTTPPEWVNGKYMWSRTVTADGAGNKTYSPSQNGVCIAGAKGEKGTGVKETITTYQLSASQTTAPTGEWLSNPPATTTNKPYLWTKIVVVFTDGSVSDSAYCVSSTLDSVEVGGRNLLLKSATIPYNTTDSRYTWFMSRANGRRVQREDGFVESRLIKIYEGLGAGIHSLNLKAGDTVTFSCMVRVVGKDTRLACFAMMYDANGTRITDYNRVKMKTEATNGFEQAHTVNIMPEDEWLTDGTIRKFAVTVLLLQDGVDLVNAGGEIWITFQTSKDYSGNTDTDYAAFYAPKLEKGNIATDWTPAPEDIEAATEEAKTMATDYITQDDTGMTVGNKQYDRNVHISPTDISIRKGEVNLARFADSLIELGLSRDFVLQILNNAIRFMGADGSAAIAHIGYGDCRALPTASSGEEEPDTNYVIESRPYYTFGIRADNSGVAPYSESDISTQASSSDIGEYSVAIGQGVEASGPNSYAEGHLTVASGYVSHAEGDRTEAWGSYTHAEGVGTKAHKDISHAEGSGSEAIGFTSHAEGNSTVASGEYSHSEGDNTKASGAASHAAGRGTIADNDAQTAVGKYNTKNSSNLFVVGNGTADDARSNAFAVGSDGQTFAASNVHTSGNFTADKNNHGVYLRRTDGTAVQELFLDASNNLAVGWGQWQNGNGTVLRAGSDLSFGIKNYGETVYRPYYRKGDVISMQWRGAGYITSSSNMVWFAIPFSKPVIGSPTVTVTSVDGLILRQGGKYVCGTAASTWKKPSSIQCSRNSDFLYIGCEMSATTNAVNNESVGIQASIKITFS